MSNAFIGAALALFVWMIIGWVAGTELTPDQIARACQDRDGVASVHDEGLFGTLIYKGLNGVIVCKDGSVVPVES